MSVPIIQVDEELKFCVQILKHQQSHIFLLPSYCFAVRHQWGQVTLDQKPWDVSGADQCRQSSTYPWAWGFSLANLLLNCLGKVWDSVCQENLDGVSVKWGQSSLQCSCDAGQWCPVYTTVRLAWFIPLCCRWQHTVQSLLVKLVAPSQHSIKGSGRDLH